MSTSEKKVNTMPGRSAMLAVGVSYIALWLGPHFLPFRGFSKGFTWRNSLSNEVRHPTCGLAGASFPDTCAAQRDGDAEVPSGGKPAANKSTPRCALPSFMNDESTGHQAGSDLALIDDFEAGDTASKWFSSNDGSGPQFPARCVLRSPLDGERGAGNLWALRTYGKSAAGFMWAKVGRNLRSPSAQCDKPFDASAFSGVRFWARGPGTITFDVGIVAVTSHELGGTCTEGCFDSHQVFVDLTSSWARYEVPFANLTQVGWGAPAHFDPSQILAVAWGATEPITGLQAHCFDFWIDDVTFYR